MISSPVTPYCKESEKPVSVANVFTADRDMELTGVSARTFFGESRVVFTIVKLEENAENPEDGEQLARFSETFPYTGFHRVDLSKPLSLKKGDRFAVIAESSYPGSSGKRTWMYAALGYFGEMARVIVHPGESFVKESGNWQDWTEAVKSIDSDGNLFDNFTIKAFYRE